MSGQAKSIPEGDTEVKQKVEDQQQVDNANVIMTSRLTKLKQQKAKAKSAFTRAKNKLNSSIEQEERPSRQSIRDQIDQLGSLQVRAMDIMVKLAELYSSSNDATSVKQIGVEMDKMETEYDAAQTKADNHLDGRSDKSSVMSLKGGMMHLFDSSEQVAIVSEGEGQNVHDDVDLDKSQSDPKVPHETCHGFSQKSVKSDLVRHIGKSGTYFGTDKYQFNQKKTRAISCEFCHDQHAIWNCKQFLVLKPEDRWNEAKIHKLCFRCLGANHRGKSCWFTKECGVNGCKSNHNKLLHVEREQSASGSSQSLGSQTERSHAARLPSESNIKSYLVALRTVPVVVKSGNKRLTINALLDDASTKSYINADVAAELGLQGETQQISVNVLNNQTETFETMPVEFGLESINGTVDINISALTTDKVTGDLKVIDWSKCSNLWSHLKDISFPEISSPPTIDLLIGMDYSGLHFSQKDVCGRVSEPIARLTPLGWTCIGKIAGACDDTHTNFASTFFCKSNDEELNSLMHRFWEAEEFSTSTLPNFKGEDESALESAKKSMSMANGRYEIGIPWKAESELLPSSNWEMAYQRLQSTEKKLSKDKAIAEAYSTVIDQHLEKGYIKKVPVEEIECKGTWFLPHFPVIKPDRKTTKVRIVFDGSARYKGMSLNDVIHQGPKLQRDLFDVLLRFRKHPVALVCDIAEMYLQIGISPQDRQYFRFLWRSMNRHEQPEVFEFTRIVFGINCSPFLAQYVSQENAKVHAEELPLASETVDKSTYMDDSMDSVENDEEAIEMYRQLTEIWGRAGMHARKWMSNSVAVLEHIPVKDRLSEFELDSGNLPSLKTLGIMWKAETDVFTFVTNLPEFSKTLSKRIFLSQIAKLFDPLGFISPFTIRAKILLQEMWTAGLEWDVVVPDDLKQKANKWFIELPELQNVKVTRCLRKADKVVTSNLHIFVDASETAYGAVAYCVHTFLNGDSTSVIVAAKGKVAPLKAVSIPRLELMAAVVGLRLATAITKTLAIRIESVRFWSDSLNVLGWIRNNSRTFKPFVANRVSEIQSSTSPSQWFFVPTNENPADLLTRGITALKLVSERLWWSGPEFLVLGQSFWPKQIVPGELQDSSQLELKRVQKPRMFTLMLCESQLPWKLDPKRFSDWQRYLRTFAWVLRFLSNSSLKKQQRVVGELTVDELQSAECRILSAMQKEVFQSEYSLLLKSKTLPSNSKLIGLKPKLDQDGVMRVDGRLVHAEHISQEAKYPIILPRKNWITKLIVKHFHDKANHVAGTNQTLAALSARFWIISGREEIREWENQCMRCKRLKAKPAQQIMAPLPKLRLNPSLRAFAQAAVDFAGPFMTTQGRGKAKHKRYLCLFTCLCSRAVHLELAFGLDTDSFLNAFYRMASRRGLPEDIVCDNGTNFVGAAKELKNLVSCLDSSAVKRSLANKGTRWHFNPPGGPHFGGVFEAMIKSAKRAIFAILQNGHVNDEELMTAFVGAESLINSRPITYQTSHPNDDVPLTPNHFLHGQVGGEFAPEAVDGTSFSPRKRWRRIQELVRHFWARWMKEWIPSLNRRSKWCQEKRDMKVGDVVLVVSSSTPRGHSPLGRVLKVYPGNDGHVRVADVQIGNSILTRPVTKLCHLELKEESWATEETRTAGEESRTAGEESRMTEEESRMTEEESRMTEEETRMTEEETRMTEEETRMTEEETRMTEEESMMTEEDSRMTEDETDDS